MRETVKAKREFDKWLARKFGDFDAETTELARECQFHLGVLALNHKPPRYAMERAQRSLAELERRLTHGT